MYSRALLVFKSIGDLLLFRNHENKMFFLYKFVSFLKPVLNCWSYSLLDNHAHFIVRIKDIFSLQQSLSNVPDTTRTVSINKFLADTGNELLVDELIVRQVNRFMVSYTNSYNQFYDRAGGLFQSPFRRLVIQEEAHLQQSVIYVHANAQKHRLIPDYRNHLYSSYNEIINGVSSIIAIDEVLTFFGGLERFIELHQEQIAYYYGLG